MSALGWLLLLVAANRSAGVVGLVPLEPAETGAWPFEGFPDRVELDGRVYVRARWQRPLAGVVQYREDRPTCSRHLLVRSGRWSIDHIDEHNPDRGRVWQHYRSDVLRIGAPGGTRRGRA
jgi:hypothetical protein